jgi:hypothetical protein
MATIFGHRFLWTGTIFTRPSHRGPDFSASSMLSATGLFATRCVAHLRTVFSDTCSISDRPPGYRLATGRTASTGYRDSSSSSALASFRSAVPKPSVNQP